MSVPREQLKFRAPPSMKLSDGSASSLTAPLEPVPATLTPAARAAARFGVSGNAIVTGGAGDIGSVACRALLEHGLRGLAIFDLHPEAGQATVNSLKTEFPEAIITFTKVDVTDVKVVTEAVAQAEQDIGPINICLCFAGIAFAAHALEIAPEQWRKMIEVNTTGAFLCAQAVAKSMVSRGTGGSIILMASISAHVVNFPQPQVHYNAAKAAILSVKSSLAAEWARYGIRVNSISPGYMDTILNEGEGLEEHRQVWKQRNPYGRMGQPEELTGAVILLASKAGNYITGADILVDGGISVF
ncbi:short chain dehydrogenase reductase family [Colletotrichum truncatum]|uniref:Short chain dehydrogenase reductase family n=1 Tax=Colletotrichum truncatum TaxID=5467 RepID=A0ACC3YND5_COLTU|nr:short chain dehydrogenase reductase family [Colletotrichum truncatum]KAF6789490.1 short chain dehydrogenase reductase family [Colletotrichum truncatum]